jgi:hypothetical protein
VAGQSLRTAICTCCCWPGESVPDDGLNETWRNPLLAADHISPVLATWYIRLEKGKCMSSGKEHGSWGEGWCIAARECSRSRLHVFDLKMGG